MSHAGFPHKLLKLVFSSWVWPSPYYAAGHDGFTHGFVSGGTRAASEVPMLQNTRGQWMTSGQIFEVSPALKRSIQFDTTDNVYMAAHVAAVSREDIRRDAGISEAGLADFAIQLGDQDDSKYQRAPTQLQYKSRIRNGKMNDILRRGSEIAFAAGSNVAFEAGDGERGLTGDSVTDSETKDSHLYSVSDESVCTSSTACTRLTCSPSLVSHELPIGSSCNRYGFNSTAESSGKSYLAGNSADFGAAPKESVQSRDIVVFHPAEQHENQHGHRCTRKPQNTCESHRQRLQGVRCSVSQLSDTESCSNILCGSPSVERSVAELPCDRRKSSAASELHSTSQRALHERVFADASNASSSTLSGGTEEGAYSIPSELQNHDTIPEVEKEALALLTGVRGRHSGVSYQWQPSSVAGPAIPGGFPYYYSTLTPQLMQLLAGQQHFYPHFGMPRARQPHLPPIAHENDGRQQQERYEPHSEAQLMRQYQQQHHYPQAQVPSQVYSGPQRPSTGFGRRFREGRRFSRENRTRPRQGHRLQRRPDLQLLLQQQQQSYPMQPQYWGSPFAAYGVLGRNEGFHPTTSLSAVLPGATNRYVWGDEYIGNTPVNIGQTASPLDPNLLPLQYRQRSAEGVRLEAQLRNQHDAWMARERSSVQ